MKIFGSLCVLLIELLSEIESKNYGSFITKETKRTSRQWNGKEPPGWLVRITNGDGLFACAGAYYSPHFVITSASCMDIYKDSLEGITVDGTAIADDENFNYANIDTAYAPDREFYRGFGDDDIAMVRLRYPISGKMTEFISLCDAEVPHGATVKIFGWGYNNIYKKDFELDPYNTTVKIMDTEKCRKHYIKRYNLTDAALCVINEEERSKCLYDRGGPLIYNNQLCGIVSWGASCLKPSNPGLYTSIYHLRGFIERINDGVANGSIA